MGGDEAGSRQAAPAARRLVVVEGLSSWHSTKFIVHGFLGYEVVIDTSVQTNVLFALADEKQTLLAWYGFKTTTERWHGGHFDAHDIGMPGFKKPVVDCDFATVDTAGVPNVYPGQLSVAGLVPRPTGGFAPMAQADITMRDLKAGMTACVLSVPSVQPAVLVLSFHLRPVRKRRTLDLKKPGAVGLIAIEKFSRTALVNGPSQAIVSSTVFRGKGSKQLCP